MTTLFQLLRAYSKHHTYILVQCIRRETNAIINIIVNSPLSEQKTMSRIIDKKANEINLKNIKRMKEENDSSSPLAKAVECEFAHPNVALPCFDMEQ